MDDHLVMSVSATTRKMRPGEIEGQDYFFIDDQTFSTMVKNGDFLEHATVFGRSYGTPRAKVEQSLDAGKDVLFDIDWQGTAQIAKSAPGKLVSVFILPPSMQELERRLRSRAQDSEETILLRMAKAEEEISHWQEYDYVIVNHSVESCARDVYAVLTSERLKRSRNYGLADFITTMLAK